MENAMVREEIEEITIDRDNYNSFNEFKLANIQNFGLQASEIWHTDNVGFYRINSITDGKVFVTRSNRTEEILDEAFLTEKTKEKLISIIANERPVWLGSIKTPEEVKKEKVREKKVSKPTRLNFLQKAHEETLINNKKYENLLLYISKNGKMGGFQAVEGRIQNFKDDYRDDTGEELPFYVICPLSNKTYGNAMRLYFMLPDGMSFDDLKEIFPKMPKKYYKDGDDPDSLPVMSDNGEIVVSNIRYIRTLLRMGFRYGKSHDIEKIKEEIERIVGRN
jgi:hypothetical protein